jgi:hypothetical protein
VNIEYELELSHVTLHNVVISIPLPPGSYPTVNSHSGTWTLNPSTHSIDWSIPLITSDADSKTGTLEFSVGGDDVEAFFPVKASFVAQGSLGNIQVRLSYFYSRFSFQSRLLLSIKFRVAQCRSLTILLFTLESISLCSHSLSTSFRIALD